MNRGNKRHGRGGWRNSGGNQHNEHDDRVGGGAGGEIKRRVTFKHQGRLGQGGKGNKRLNDVMIRAALDDDEDMDDQIGAEGGGFSGGPKPFIKGKRGGMRGGRRGSPPPRITKKKLQQGISEW